MTQWHADLDTPILKAGARLTVLSDHHVVRVITADTLSIENPLRHRFSAVVLDRTGGDIRLVLEDGSSYSLGMVVDQSLQTPGEQSGVFSRQIWVTH